ncbi:MAG TPA: carbohydrate ABC transporter permease [Fimbriimonadaceae bacterium]|nr:carbohydrate ABC transporter permease [Fimbriimonadaceae bacterium]
MKGWLRKVLRLTGIGGKYTFLCVYIIVVVLPIAWMAVSSFKTTREIYNSPWTMPHAFVSRENPLHAAGVELAKTVHGLPGDFPSEPAEAREVSEVFQSLATDPTVHTSADGRTVVDKPGGPIGRIRLYAPELRDVGSLGGRAKRMARNLAAYADEAEQGSSRVDALKERLGTDYGQIKGDLVALGGQAQAKARQGVFGNYVEAWTTTGIGRAFMNSLLVSLATIVVLIPISAMASYVLAKIPFRGSRALFLLFLGGMMFPQFLVIVPLFLQMSKLGIDDNLFGLTLVYIAFSLPFTVFVLTGFFHQLPDELGEAAMLDGCSHHGVFWKVMWPLAKPGLVVVTIFDVIGLWNEYNLALVLMRTTDRFTLPRALDSLQLTAQYLGDTGALMAAMIIVILPVLAVYWLLKDKIHEAMLAGAVKG